MWTVSNSFVAALNSPIQEVRSKIEIMDTDFNVIAVVGEQPDEALLDGTVDVDVTRGTRRTLTVSLLNKDGAFSPTSDWGGLFYVNRLIRLYRGLVIGDTGTNEEIEYVPIGTFMIDKTEAIVERSMSTVVMAGSDLWKKFQKSQFASPLSWPKGTSINTIIAYLCSYSGVTRMSLDPMTDRTSLSKNIQATLAFEKGDTAGDALLKLCGDHGLDIFFDSLGVLVTEDFRLPESRPSVWSYGYTADSGNLDYLIRSVTEDDRLYNSVYVTGTADPEHVYVASLTNNDPSSPVNVARLGRRVYRYESGVIGSQEAANKAAQTLFYKTSLLSHSVALEAICHPALEGNDAVTVIEPFFTGVSDKFIVQSFTIPLVTSKQKVVMKRSINLNLT